MGIRALAVGLATTICVALVAHEASAQVLVRGKVTDTWGNPLEGVQVEAQRPDRVGGSTRSEVTDKKGEFLMIGLDTTDYEFAYSLDGYQPTIQVREIRTQRSPGRSRRDAPPVELELLNSGQFLGEEFYFEAEGGTHKLTLKPDGMFEFEDAEGEGLGNYFIEDLSAVLTVRDYDGKKDDKYSIAEPVVLTTPNNSFLTLVWGETTLKKIRR